MLGKHVVQRVVEELHKLCGHIPQDVELRVEGGQVRSEAPLGRCAAQAPAQLGNGLLALGAGQLHQDVGALVSGRDHGDEGVGHVLKVLVDEVEQGAGIAKGRNVSGERVQGCLVGLDGSLALQVDAGFVELAVIVFDGLDQPTQGAQDGDGGVKPVCGRVSVQGGGIWHHLVRELACYVLVQCVHVIWRWGGGWGVISHYAPHTHTQTHMNPHITYS